MYGQGFIDVNEDSEGYGTFDVPEGSTLNTFDAGDRLVLKAQGIKEKADSLAATGDYSNKDMCDSLLKEFHSARTVDGKYFERQRQLNSLHLLLVLTPSIICKNNTSLALLKCAHLWTVL